MQEPKNLIIYEQSESFLKLLESFGAVEKGHFEYKGKAPDGTRLHGEYYINYRRLSSDQEAIVAQHYVKAISQWFPNQKNMIIVGVAMGSLIVPKVIQLKLFPQTGIEYAYTEKREGILGIFGEQLSKCHGKHLLFIEDVCNNGTSTRELMKISKDFSILYGVHRAHEYFEEPKGAFYAMSQLQALSYHCSECPACKEGNIPLKAYKK